MALTFVPRSRPLDLGWRFSCRAARQGGVKDGNNSGWNAFGSFCFVGLMTHADAVLMLHSAFKESSLPIWWFNVVSECFRFQIFLVSCFNLYIRMMIESTD